MFALNSIAGLSAEDEKTTEVSTEFSGHIFNLK
jgi:hypothetical protein